MSRRGLAGPGCVDACGGLPRPGSGRRAPQQGLLAEAAAPPPARLDPRRWFEFAASDDARHGNLQVLARLQGLHQLVVNRPWKGMAGSLKQLSALTCLAVHTQAGSKEIEEVVEAAVQLPGLHRLALRHGWTPAAVARIREALPGCELHVVTSEELLWAGT